MKEKYMKLLIGIIIAILISLILSYLSAMKYKKTSQSMEGLLFGTSSSSYEESDKDKKVDFDDELFMTKLKALKEEVAKPFVIPGLEENKKEEIKKDEKVENTEVKKEENKKEAIEEKDANGNIVKRIEFLENNQEKVMYYENNSLIKTEFRTVDPNTSKANGEATVEYENGNSQTFTYKDGILDGPTTIIYKNGEKEEASYKNGILNGKSTYFFTNGDKEVYNYVNGTIKGSAKYIYKNGQVDEYEY